MSDIVKRLKAYAKDQGGWHNIDDTCEEAADEIERLREHRDHMRAVVECAGFNSVTEALVEIERLRAEVARLVKSRNKWGQKYNQTLEKLKLAVWTDTEEVKAANEAANAAVVARDEAIREVSRLGRELGTEQARLAEAVEVISDLMRISPPGRLTLQASDVDRRASNFLAKLEGR